MSKLRQVCRVCMRKEGKTKFQRILSENFTVAHDLFFTCGVMVCLLFCKYKETLTFTS